jgi:hypothetical protein
VVKHRLLRNLNQSEMLKVCYVPIVSRAMRGAWRRLANCNASRAKTGSTEDSSHASVWTGEAIVDITVQDAEKNLFVFK